MSSSSSAAAASAATTCQKCGRRCTNGASKCHRCATTGIIQRKKCDVDGCNQLTPVCYAQCHGHYRQWQHEIETAREALVRDDRRKTENGPPRPYRSRSGAETSRRESPQQQQQPPPSQPRVDRHKSTRDEDRHTAPRDNGPRIVKLNSSSGSGSSNTAPIDRQMPTPTPPPPAAAAAAPPPPPLPPVPEVIPAAKAVNRSVAPVADNATTHTQVTAATAVAPPRVPKRRGDPAPPQKPTRSIKRHIDPTVIWEYECGACNARNVVRREVRFLQTHVEVEQLDPVENNDNDHDYVTSGTREASNVPVDNSHNRNSTHAPADTMAPRNNYTAVVDNDTDDVDRELKEILDCRDEVDCSDTHFEIAIPRQSGKEATNRFM